MQHGPGAEEFRMLTDRSSAAKTSLLRFGIVRPFRHGLCEILEAIQRQTRFFDEEFGIDISHQYQQWNVIDVGIVQVRQSRRQAWRGMQQHYPISPLAREYPSAIASEEFSFSEEMNLICLIPESEEMSETVVEPGTPKMYFTPSPSRKLITRSAIMRVNSLLSQ